MNKAEQRVSYTEKKFMEDNEAEKKRETKAKERDNKNKRTQWLIKKEEHKNHRIPRRWREKKG